MNGIRQSFLRFRQEAGGALRYGVGILCLYWLWGEHVLTVTGTSGPSMYPTLAAQGDFVLIANYYRRGRGIKVGDQVSVKHPLFTQMGAGKRVIGMPGDFVVRDPDMSVDAAMDGTMIQVPEGHCWLQGDNLPWSRDSRNYGPVPLALIKGKMIARVWPPKRWKRINDGLKPAQSSVEKEQKVLASDPFPSVAKD